MTRALRLTAIALAAMLLAAACSGNSGDEPTAGASTTSRAPDGSPTTLREVVLPDLTLTASLTPFDSCDALLGWIHEEAAARVGPYGLPGTGYFGPVVTDDMAVEESLAGAESTDVAAPRVAGTDFSTTNVQVEGVDEPDVVKTDGERLYALANGELHVVDVTGDQPRKLGSVSIENGYGADLLLAGDTVLVLTHEVWALPFAAESLDVYGFVPDIPGSTLTLVDASDPAAPQVTETLTVEGSVVSARMVDGVVRVVVSSQPQLALGFVYPSVANEAAESRATAVNREVLMESTLDDWMPSFVVTDDSGAVTANGPVTECGDVSRPQEFSGFGMLSVMTVDIGKGLSAGVSSAANAGVMSGGETVYASPEHLYVATTEYVDWEALDSQEQEDFDDDWGTAIHRFEISDPNRTSYEGSGRVDGTLLNQFAMDESDGVLRVASTAGSPWGTGQDTSESFVTTLELRDGQLVPLGRVGDLGRGETIQSVRFIGDRGYVVTFRQTDPLYVVDLTDPASPAVTGELKILGFSAYLHPVADGYLLGVGQDATEEGQRLGTQVSLFDVRDPANPTRVSQAALGGGSSAVEWDHRAFLWWAPDGLAMVPVELWDSEQFSGAYGFDVDTRAGTVAVRGRVENRPFAVAPGQQAEPTPSNPVEPEPQAIDPDIVTPEPPADEIGATEGAAYEWVPPVTRAVVVDGTIYTLSELGLLQSDLTTLSPSSWIGF